MAPHPCAAGCQPALRSSGNVQSALRSRRLHHENAPRFSDEEVYDCCDSLRTCLLSELGLGPCSAMKLRMGYAQRLKAADVLILSISRYLRRCIARQVQRVGEGVVLRSESKADTIPMFDETDRTGLGAQLQRRCCKINPLPGIPGWSLDYAHWHANVCRWNALVCA